MYNESIIPAKKGLTVLAGDTALHSRYDPAAEAAKYIDSLDLKPYKYFVLLEPGLGYLAASLKNKFPPSTVISLHCSSFFKSGTLSWNPSSGGTLDNFLEIVFSDADASDIKIIEWKPSINAYGKACLELASAAVECIRRINAGRKTVRAFGKRWVKNAINNISLLNRIIKIKQGSMPVLVCAAGPSLGDSINYITAWKNSPSPPFIIAVSSAAPALLYNGITPDSIITTDGGSWANFHLYECFRHCGNNAAVKPVIASSLTAILPSQINDFPALIIRDGSIWQDVLLQAAGILQYSPGFPQRGTVSASALDTAYFLSNGEIYICGMDLSHRDLLTHTRPHAFEKIPEQKQCRKNPYYSQIFEREETIRSSGSHDIYAAWFTSHLASFPRLHTLGESKYGIPSGKPPKNKPVEKVQFTVHGINNKLSKIHCIEVLQNAMDNSPVAEKLGRELAELLLPGKPAESIKTSEIKKALMELTDG